MEFSELEKELENKNVLQTLETEHAKFGLKKPYEKVHRWSQILSVLATRYVLLKKRNFKDKSFSELNDLENELYQSTINLILGARNYSH